MSPSPLADAACGSRTTVPSEGGGGTVGSSAVGSAVGSRSTADVGGCGRARNRQLGASGIPSAHKHSRACLCRRDSFRSNRGVVVNIPLPVVRRRRAAARQFRLSDEQRTRLHQRRSHPRRSLMRSSLAMSRNPASARTSTIGANSRRT